MRCALIDFAHAFFGEVGPDSNLLGGVRVLQAALQPILASCGSCNGS